MMYQVWSWSCRGLFFSVWIWREKIKNGGWKKEIPSHSKAVQHFGASGFEVFQWKCFVSLIRTHLGTWALCWVCPCLTWSLDGGGWVWCLNPQAELRLPAKLSHSLLSLSVPVGSKETPPLVTFTFTHTCFPGQEVKEDLAALERDAKRWCLHSRGKRTVLLFTVRGGTARSGKVKTSPHGIFWGIRFQGACTERI